MIKCFITLERSSEVETFCHFKFQQILIGLTNQLSAKTYGASVMIVYILGRWLSWIKNTVPSPWLLFRRKHVHFML